MNISDRRKLAMASSVRDFFATHPYDNAGYTAAGQQLALRIGRADELVRQQIAGRQAVSGAVARRQELRTEISASLALLTGLMRQAAREEPNLGVALKRPEHGEGIQAFLARVRVGAAAELTSVVAAIMDLVRQLDTINRFRFRDDAESLAAWRSARNVAWPVGEKSREPDQGIQPAA